MNVLIFGGAGYIGSVLTMRLLESSFRVTVADNLLWGPNSILHHVSNENFSFVYGDVRDKRFLKDIIPNFDVIIPLSAIVGAPQCDKNQVDAKLINEDSIVNINHIRSSSQMMLFPNTNSGYGVTSGEILCSEETPINPISLYGKTKCAAEQVLKESRKSFISFRLATAFGMSPRMRTDLLLNNFVLKAVVDNCIVVFEKEFKRNFVHVKDIAECFLFAINNYSNMSGQVYNLGLDSANVSKQELAEKIKAFLPEITIIYAKIGQDVDKRNYIVSNQKLKQAGFEAKYTLEYGIQELIKGYNIMLSKDVFRQ